MDLWYYRCTLPEHWWGTHDHRIQCHRCSTPRLSRTTALPPTISKLPCFYPAHPLWACVPEMVWWGLVICPGVSLVWGLTRHRPRIPRPGKCPGEASCPRWVGWRAPFRPSWWTKSKEPEMRSNPWGMTTVPLCLQRRKVQERKPILMTSAMRKALRHWLNAWKPKPGLFSTTRSWLS